MQKHMQQIEQRQEQHMQLVQQQVLPTALLSEVFGWLNILEFFGLASTCKQFSTTSASMSTLMLSPVCAKNLQKILSRIVVNIVRCVIDIECTMDDNNLEQLAVLQNVEYFSGGNDILHKINVTHVGLTAISNFKNLKRLTVQHIHANESHWRDLFLSTHKNLEYLCMIGCDINNIILRHMRENLVELRALTIGKDILTNINMGHIAQLTKLICLGLFCNRMTNSAFHCITDLKNLQDITLQCNHDFNINNNLKYVSQISSLKNLSIQHCNLLVDKGVQHIINSPLMCNLTSLDVTHCKDVSVNCYENVEKLQKLRSLSIGSWVNISTIRCVAQLKQLHTFGYLKRKSLVKNDIIQQMLPNVNIVID